jgi:hypothetical protein
MQAVDMTFGVEIECFLPVEVMSANNIQVGHYHGGLQIPGLPEGWKAQSDGSLHSRSRNLRPVEISSPVLKGREGILQLQAVLRQLKTWGFKTNPSCGLHVHVGAELAGNVRVVRNLVNLCAKFERGLFAITGTKRREAGHYSAPISEAYRAIENANNWADFQRVAVKYRSVNLCHLFGSYKTVEFRVFQGTTSETKILAYVQVCLGLVERAHAIKRKPSFQTLNKRYRSGAAVVYTMLRNIGWNAEKRFGDRKFGLLMPELLDELKAELGRLARKYDSEQVNGHHALRCPVPAPTASPAH